MGAFFFAVFAMTQKLISKNLPPELIRWGVICSGFLIVFLAGIFEALVFLFMNQAI